jgi:hypothetical protein
VVCCVRSAERSTPQHWGDVRAAWRVAMTWTRACEGGVPRTVVRRTARPDDSDGVVGAARVIQIDELGLYNREGEIRTIPLRARRLNVITGDSRTGS